MNVTLPPFAKQGDKISASMFNKLIEAIRRCTIISGGKVSVSQGTSGTKIETQGGAAESSNDDYPLKLALEKDVSSGKFYCIFHAPKHSVSLDGEEAVCINNESSYLRDNFPNSVWCRVADDYTLSGNVGHVVDAQIELLKEGEKIDIYALVAKKKDGFCYYLVAPSDIYITTTSEDIYIPEGMGDEFVSKFCIGTVERTGTDNETGDPIFEIVNQAVSSSTAISSGSEGESKLFPFKIMKDVKSDSSYVPVIWIPQDAVQCSGVPVYWKGLNKIDGNWFQLENSISTVYLNIFTYRVMGETGLFKIECTVDGKGEGSSSLVDGLSTQHKSYVIGVIDHEQQKVQNYLMSAVIVKSSEDIFIEGGGTLVTLDDQRDNKNSPGIIGVQGEVSGDGINLIARDAIPVSMVGFTNENGVITVGLEEYLKGILEVGTFGTNLSSVNYERFLFAEVEGGTGGSSPTASRSDHTHTIDDIVGADGTGGVSIFSNSEGIISIFTDAGMWEPLGTKAEENIISESDVNFDFAERFQKDSKDGSAGGTTGGKNFLCLDNHSHPLNVDDEGDPMPIMLDSGPESMNPPYPPSGMSSAYARADHIHVLPLDGTGANGIGSATSPDGNGLDPGTAIPGSNFGRGHDQEWDRDSDKDGKGFKYTICCGMKLVNKVPYSFFREITVDKYGLVRHISAVKYGICCDA